MKDKNWQDMELESPLMPMAIKAFMLPSLRKPLSVHKGKGRTHKSKAFKKKR